MESEEVISSELMNRWGLRRVEGVYYAEVHVDGRANGVCVALHGARTLVQAVDALVAFGQRSKVTPAVA